MKEIKLIVQKQEDIILLVQGINWIRNYIIDRNVKIFGLLKNLPTEQEKSFHKTISDSVETYDRLMSLLAQLDKELENYNKNTKNE